MDTSDDLGRYVELNASCSRYVLTERLCAAALLFKLPASVCSVVVVQVDLLLN